MSAIRLSEIERAGMRRQQVLKAATECFRLHGFHSASMAQIAKAAEMSVGHIYHYFANKEAVIAAIVAQDVGEGLELIRSVGNSDDIIKSLVEDCDQCVTDCMNLEKSGLMLEIMAEASRNPKIAQIVQDADRLIRQGFLDLLQRAYSDRPEITSDMLVSRSEVLASVFDGLRIRAICNPGLDSAALKKGLRQVVRCMLELEH